MILLTQEAKTIHPVALVCIIGFIIVFILCLIYDKKKAKKFSENFLKEYEGKMADGDAVFFITTERELVMPYIAPTFSGYKIFKLDEVAYVMTAWDRTCKSWILALYDKNKKSIKGKEFRSTKKKPLKAKAYFTTDAEAIERWEMIHKYVPDAKHVGIYFKDRED